MRRTERFWDLGNLYRYRDDNLARLGFASYRSYLRSALWQSIRARVIATATICQGCSRALSTQVHHRAYDPATLRGDNLNSLSAVCARCHRRGERPTLPQHASDRMAHANQVSLRARKKAAARHRSGWHPKAHHVFWNTSEKPKRIKTRKPTAIRALAMPSPDAKPTLIKKS